MFKPNDIKERIIIIPQPWDILVYSFDCQEVRHCLLCSKGTNWTVLPGLSLTSVDNSVISQAWAGEDIFGCVRVFRDPSRHYQCRYVTLIKAFNKTTLCPSEAFHLKAEFRGAGLEQTVKWLPIPIRSNSTLWGPLTLSLVKFRHQWIPIWEPKNKPNRRSIKDFLEGGNI